MAGLAIVGLLCFIVVLGMFCALHWLYPDHGWIDDPVSNYGVGASRPMFRIYGAIGIIGALILAWLFYNAPQFPRSIALYLVLMVAARIGLLVFPTDLEGMAKTISGKLHLLFAVASFTFLYMAIDDGSTAFAALPADSLKGIWMPLKWFIAASLAGVVLAMVVPPLKGWFGLVERAFLLSTALWMALACYRFAIMA